MWVYSKKYYKYVQVLKRKNFLNWPHFQNLRLLNFRLPLLFFFSKWILLHDFNCFNVNMSFDVFKYPFNQIRFILLSSTFYPHQNKHLNFHFLLLPYLFPFWNLINLQSPNQENVKIIWRSIIKVFIILRYYNVQKNCFKAVYLKLNRLLFFNKISIGFLSCELPKSYFIKKFSLFYHLFRFKKVKYFLLNKACCFQFIHLILVFQVDFKYVFLEIFNDSGISSSSLTKCISFFYKSHIFYKLLK